jgi:peptidyl-prolyl cis-trans isomerase B (cyclophilin B)
MRWLLGLLVPVLLTGCPGGKPSTHPGAPSDARVEIARLEARRGGGVDMLIERARSGDAGTRDLALRALGRVGGARALDALVAALEDPSPAIATRAAAALGVLASTTDPPPTTITRTSSALVAALARAGVDVPVVIEALGRAGDASALAPLAGRTAASDAAIAESAALALGRFGRRELPIDAPARAALAEATIAAAPGVRHAAVWALGRERRGEKPAPDPAVTAALVAAVDDPDGETRAAAIAALARRKTVADGASAIEQGLRDQDWRVAVEAVRALAGEAGTDAGRDAVAAITVRIWTLVVTGSAPAQAHVLLEGLRALAASAHRPAVRDALRALATASSGSTSAGVPPIVRGWVHCLSTAALERVTPTTFDGGTRVLACGGDPIEPHLRAQLLGELITAGVGTPRQRRDALVVLLAIEDPRSRAAALDALPTAWSALTAAEQEALIPAVTRALASTAVIEVGTAAEAAGALLAKDDLIASARTPVAAALIARAAHEADPEVAGDLLRAVGAAKLAEGTPVCERAVASESPVIRAAARDCLTLIAGGKPPDPARVLDEPTVATPPAVDVDAVVGRRVTWTLETTRGTVVIALAPEVAPWNVASIAELTRKRFYDGLVFHRVVPDFVVQGGDPTGTGWGGPGYTLPAEPGSGLDGDDYRAGAIGIADAGKDSGGSQWFAMHSRAPHLEGRYTRVGRVTRGQEIVDALVIGDKVVKASVSVE